MKTRRTESFKEYFLPGSTNSVTDGVPLESELTDGVLLCVDQDNTIKLIIDVPYIRRCYSACTVSVKVTQNHRKVSISDTQKQTVTINPQKSYKLIVTREYSTEFASGSSTYQFELTP